MKTNEPIGKRIVNSLVDLEAFGWPPSCIGFFHQPERPTKMPQPDQDDDNALNSAEKE